MQARMGRRLRGVASAALFSAWFLQPMPVAAQRIPYAVEALGVPTPYFSPVSYWINDSGQIAGNMQVGEDTEHAFFGVDGTFVDLGTFGGSDSKARAINNLGYVVGWAAGDGRRRHPFIWTGGDLMDLGAFDSGASSLMHGAATDVNDLGQVVGYSRNEAEEIRAFLVTPENGVWFRDENGNGFNDLMQDLGTLGGSSAFARAINNAGVILGRADTADGDQHAFVWVDGVMQDLGPLWPVDINDAGQVLASGGGVGLLITPQEGVWYLDDDGDDVNDLARVIEPPEPVFTVFILDLTNNGQVLGWNDVYPFVWQDGTAAFLHEMFLLTTPEWNVDAAEVYGMNDAGQFVATAFKDGVQAPILVSPVQPHVVDQSARYVTVSPPPGTLPFALVLTSAEAPCVEAYIDAQGRAGEEPVYQSAAEWGTVFVHGREVVPGVTYRVHAEFSDPDATVTEPVQAVTATWGDTAGPFADGRWSTPDGLVDLADVLAALDTFASRPGAPPVTRVDLMPEAPDGQVNVLDILAILDAFSGGAYPFAPPCP